MSMRKAYRYKENGDVEIDMNGIPINDEHLDALVEDIIKQLEKEIENEEKHEATYTKTKKRAESRKV